MQLPGSMNIAPPPETRRTTSMWCRAAPSGSTSLRTDWNEPMTTSGLSQSQKRSVGGRSPDPTSRAMTSSRATCMAGCSTRAGMTSKAWSCQPVALPSARRTAMPTASGVNPMSATSGPRAPWMAEASWSTPASTGIPRSAALMSSRASSGSRKKSPDTLTSPSLPRRPPGRPPRACLRAPCTHHACLHNTQTPEVCRVAGSRYGRQPVSVGPRLRATPGSRRTTAPWPRRRRRCRRRSRAVAASRRRRPRARPARGRASRGRGVRIASRESRARGCGRARPARGRIHRRSACPTRSGSVPGLGVSPEFPSERR